jgi:hypothetical protein
MSPRERQEIIQSIRLQIDFLTEEVAQAIRDGCSAEQALRTLKFFGNLLARLESQGRLS